MNQLNKTKDKVRKFDTGAVRDSGGKFDFVEYMSTLAMARYAEHMKKNAIKYGAGNWLKGIPYSEFMKSLRRHLWIIDVQEQTGVQIEPETDHFGAAMFNLMGAIHEQEILKLKDSDEYFGYPIDKTNMKRNDASKTR
jgi:hypothetical protein